MNQLLFKKYNVYKILRIFFNKPTTNFQLRQISRIIKLSHKSVLQHLKFLLKLNLIKINKKTLYKSYIANTEYGLFREYKRTDNLIQIYESDLIQHLKQKLLPNCIIIYGSYSDGYDIEKSDIDIFIQSEEKELNLREFERKLGRTIHLIFETDIKNISKELLNNLINGIVVYGKFRIKR